ncbi:hypothetical protein IKG06_03095 [Candidatus Saccharibacteria bacterium]|nr:hypothetical protein [Candidatus Saccharibacteria bacterium]
MFNQPAPAMPPITPQMPVQGVSTHPTMASSGVDKLNKSVKNSLIKTIAIILLSLLLIGALLLSVYFYNEYQSAQSDVDSKIANAIVDAKKEVTDALEEEFAEREKIPYSNFTGPEDYGRVGFKYPKTWSVYIAKDASKGGDFEAYLHPSEVPAVSNNTIFALRVIIRSESFETAANRYQSLVNSKEKKLESSVINVSTTTANRYDGTLPNNLIGSIVIFKLRDKVVTLETDAEIYRDDFNKILESITFNE